MYNLLLAVPEQLKDLWYLYDLALLAIIGISIVVLMLLRKRSDQKEAEKSLRTAKNILRKSKNSTVQRRRFLLFKAKNVLNTAEYYYSRCISEEDKYEYIITVNSIKDAIEKLDDLMKNKINISKEDYDKSIDSILRLL